MTFINTKKFQAFQNKDMILKNISLYKIDQILQEKAEIELSEDSEETQELIQKKLPREYYEFKDIFSKAKSNELSSHQTYDHKIILKASQDIKYSSFYKMSITELEAVQQYLIENLKKGFIILSNAFFASSVLFVKKPNKDLRFCIDYQKLNIINKKD